MTLRGPPEKKEKSPGKGVFTFRIDPARMAYLEEAAHKTKTDKTKVVMAALDLDRDLDSFLVDVRSEIREFAEAQGLSLSRDLARVLADLVRLGLGARKHRGKK